MDESTIAYLLGGVIIAGAYFKFLHEPAASKESIQNASKSVSNSATTRKRNVPDFYGVDELENDPEGFGKKIRESDKNLLMGKEVAVKASHALYLMRNSKYHNLIVSEEGSVRLKHDGEVILDVESIEKTNDIIASTIMNFNEDSSSKIKMPGFVKEVQEIADGGVRWVYADWHARDCGIESACYDRFGRAIPDPDKKEEDDGKGKRSGGRESGKEKLRENDSLLVDVSKKLTKVTNMLTEQRTDEMLAIQGLLDPKSETLSKERGVEVASAILDSIEAKSPRSTLLIPVEYKDELDEMEEEFAMPDFSLAIEKGFETSKEDVSEKSLEENLQAVHEQRETVQDVEDSVEEIVHEADFDDADLEEQNEDAVFEDVDAQQEDDSHVPPKFYYTDRERFLSLTASRFDFAEAFLNRFSPARGKGLSFWISKTKSPWSKKITLPKQQWV